MRIKVMLWILLYLFFNFSANGSNAATVPLVRPVKSWVGGSGRNIKSWLSTPSPSTIQGSPHSQLNERSPFPRSLSEFTPEVVLILPTGVVSRQNGLNLISAAGGNPSAIEDTGVSPIEAILAPGQHNGTGGNGVLLLNVGKHMPKGEDDVQLIPSAARAGALACGVVVAVFPYQAIRDRLGGVSSGALHNTLTASLAGLLEYVTFHAPSSANTTLDATTKGGPLQSSVLAVVTDFDGTARDREEVEFHVGEVITSVWNNLVLSSVYLANDGRQRSWNTTAGVLPEEIRHSNTSATGDNSGEEDQQIFAQMPSISVDVSFTSKSANSEENRQVFAGIRNTLEQRKVDPRIVRRRLGVALPLVKGNIHTSAKIIPASRDVSCPLASVRGEVDVNKLRLLRRAELLKQEVYTIFTSFLVRRSMAQAKLRESISNNTTLQRMSGDESQNATSSENQRLRKAVELTTAMGVDHSFATDLEKAIHVGLALFDASYGDYFSNGTISDSASLDASKRLSLQVKALKRMELLDMMRHAIQPIFENQVSLLQSIALNMFHQKISSSKMDSNVVEVLQSSMKEADDTFTASTRRLLSPVFNDMEPKGDGLFARVIKEARHDLSTAMKKMCSTVVDHAKLSGVLRETEGDGGGGLLKGKFKVFNRARAVLRRLGLPPLSIGLHYLSPNAFGFTDVIRDFASQGLDMGARRGERGDVMTEAEGGAMEASYDVRIPAEGRELSKADERIAESLMFPYGGKNKR